MTNQHSLTQFFADLLGGFPAPNGEMGEIEKPFWARLSELDAKLDDAAKARVMLAYALSLDALGKHGSLPDGIEGILALELVSVSMTFAINRKATGQEQAPLPAINAPFSKRMQ